ncbi:MAG: flagellar basal body P-ring formation protein FlgA [Deltaproteobacteria bacterium]|nr:flagellar basal body P-ring formation protein FlgA [Deltaproteobacteria bacterium]MBW2139279.1 flagellar basal body P-ring formation protein FlgA [Deltaproteobacteria bacterium]
MMKRGGTIIALLCLWWIFLSAPPVFGIEPEAEGKCKPGYQCLSKERLMEVFKGYLSRHWAKPGLDIQVSKFRIRGNRSVPVGNLDIRVFQKDRKELRGYVRLVALIVIEGEVKSRLVLSGWVDIFDSVICASRDLRKGEILGIEDIYLERRNISRLSPSVLSDVNKALGLMIKHNVKRGFLIKTWMLQKEPVVKRGGIVTIVAESKAVKVTVPGRVLEKGYMGQLVMVQNTMSKKRIYAKVTGSDTVRVDF